MKQYVRFLFAFLLLVTLSGFAWGEDVVTASIIFGSGNTTVASTSVNVLDSQGGAWIINTTFPGKQTSFTTKTDCVQIGSSTTSASSIIASMSCTDNIVITSFEAKFSGSASGTAGNVVLKVGDEQVQTGVLNATNAVTVSATGLSLNALGKNISVSVTDIAKGVLLYYIKYSYTVVPSSVAAPCFNIESGEYYDAQDVVISAASGASVFYTLDGTKPTSASTEYTAPIHVTETSIIKAVAYEGDVASNVSVLSISIVDKPVMLVGQAQNGKYYAMSNRSGSASSSLAAVEVYVNPDGVVLLDARDESLLWMIEETESNKGYIKTLDGRYLYTASGSTDITLSSTKREWTYDTSKGYWECDTRPLLGFVDKSSVYFKNYAASQIGGTNFFSTPAITRDYDIFEPSNVEVALNAKGFASLYYGRECLTVPAGVSAWTFWVEDEELKAGEAYGEGTVIPAGTGVVLYSAKGAGTYTFTTSINPSAMPVHNDLKGTDESMEVSVEQDGNVLYMLANGSQGMGFYMVSADGRSFTNGAHKAYLEAPPVTEAAGVRSFVLEKVMDDIVTAVQTDLVCGSESKPVVYSLQGLRVEQPSKGLYIVNGKKMMIR